MKHLWKGFAALALLGATGVLTAPGCVDAEAPFFIIGVKAQTCDATSIDGANLGSGALDVRYNCNYYAILELGNQLVKRGDETKLQIETSRISVTSVDVQIFAEDGVTPVQNSAGNAQFSFPVTGFIDPASGTEPGRGLAEALLIDPGTAFALANSGGGKVIARVVARGRTLGGDDLKTRPFDFPIDVCLGCLCFAPTDDACVNSEAGPEDDCLINQDFQFDCRWIGRNCNEPAICGVF
ncbi:MAG: hypothetical protein IPK82_07635 [Polyangiaceae bacterium]|nr:hypothetical protein [Polyangiaceae bacterium]